MWARGRTLGPHRHPAAAPPTPPRAAFTPSQPPAPKGEVAPPGGGGSPLRGSPVHYSPSITGDGAPAWPHRPGGTPTGTPSAGARPASTRPPSPAPAPPAPAAPGTGRAAAAGAGGRVKGSRRCRDPGAVPLPPPAPAAIFRPPAALPAPIRPAGAEQPGGEARSPPPGLGARSGGAWPAWGPQPGWRSVGMGGGVRGQGAGSTARTEGTKRLLPERGQARARGGGGHTASPGGTPQPHRGQGEGAERAPGSPRARSPGSGGSEARPTGTQHPARHPASWWPRGQEPSSGRPRGADACRGTTRCAPPGTRHGPGAGLAAASRRPRWFSLVCPKERAAAVAHRLLSRCPRRHAAPPAPKPHQGARPRAPRRARSRPARPCRHSPGQCRGFGDGLARFHHAGTPGLLPRGHRAGWWHRGDVPWPPKGPPGTALARGHQALCARHGWRNVPAARGRGRCRRAPPLASPHPGGPLG